MKRGKDAKEAKQRSGRLRAQMIRGLKGDAVDPDTAMRVVDRWDELVLLAEAADGERLRGKVEREDLQRQVSELVRTARSEQVRANNAHSRVGDLVDAAREVLDYASSPSRRSLARLRTALEDLEQT